MRTASTANLFVSIAFFVYRMKFECCLLTLFCMHIWNLRGNTASSAVLLTEVKRGREEWKISLKPNKIVFKLRSYTNRIQRMVGIRSDSCKSVLYRFRPCSLFSRFTSITPNTEGSLFCSEQFVHFFFKISYWILQIQFKAQIKERKEKNKK